MTMFMLRSSMALLSVMLLGACATEEDHVDEGTACVAGEVGQPHDVSVDFGLCTSSSCDEVLHASCSATLEGTTLTVEATARIRSKDGQCTEDCVSVTTDCQTPALAAGAYTLVYGEGSVELTVPVAMATCAHESM
jgi:hypothetical protein